MSHHSILLFSKGDIKNWKGLPKNLLIAELIQLFGEPAKIDQQQLGYYPAQRYDFTDSNNPGGLLAYVREQNVVLIETKTLPDIALLQEIGQPDATFPQEMLVDGAYAAEYVFCDRGLNLTVAKHFDKSLPDMIVRCRGFESISKPEEFDARFYKAFEDTILW